MPSFLAVIDGSIDPELILHESTFLGAAGDAIALARAILASWPTSSFGKMIYSIASSESAICLFKHRFLPPQLFFSY